MTPDLWYDAPASYWEGALPLGNGALGAMVFGGVPTERYQLNADTIWSGPPEYTFNPEAPKLIDQAREMIRRRQFSRATEFIDREVLLTRDECQSYQTAGDLLLELQLPAANRGDYRRGLSLRDATSEVLFTSGGVRFRQRSFFSHPAACLCVALSASGPRALDFTVRLRSPMPFFRTETVAADAVVGWGRAFNMNPDYGRPQKSLDRMWNEEQRVRRAVRYCIAVRVLASGADAQVEAADGQVQVCTADAARVLLTIVTSFDGHDREPGSAGRAIAAEALQIVGRAAARGHEELAAEHRADHRRLFDRVSLRLGGHRPEPESLPTDRRLAALAGAADDPGMCELLFDYGRYLLIASSRPGSEPANLQGIWNHLVQPPWAGRYTININTQMNYWPARVCNLAECEEPLLTMVEQLSRSGRSAARTLYGSRGWCAHHNTDLWRWSAPVHFKTRHAFWPLGGAWRATCTRATCSAATAPTWPSTAAPSCVGRPSSCSTCSPRTRPASWWCRPPRRPRTPSSTPPRARLPKCAPAARWIRPSCARCSSTPWRPPRSPAGLRMACAPSCARPWRAWRCRRWAAAASCWSSPLNSKNWSRAIATSPTCTAPTPGPR